MSDMEDLLHGVAKKLDMAIDLNHLEQTSWHFERVLREYGLLRLLEAGQGMRDLMKDMEFNATFPQEDEYDAALAALKEKVAST